MKRLTAAVLSLLLICTLLCACNIQDVSVVATVNGEDISLEEYKFYIINTKQVILQNAGATSDSPEFWNTTDLGGKKAGEYVKETALEEAIRYTLLAQEAKKAGISADSADAKKQISDSKSMIISSGVSDEAATSVATKVYLAVNLIEQKKEKGEIDVSDENIKKIYEENYRTIKHILYSKTDPMDGAELYTSEETLLMANNALDVIKSGEEDFDTIMNRESTDPGLASNPDGYTFTNNGTMVEPFEKAAFKLEIGEISEAVGTDYGHHILKREPLVPYEEFVATNGDVISADIENKYVEELEVKLKSKAKITKDEKVYKNVNITKI